MDVADQPFTIRNSRWRTWLRARTPSWLYDRGLVVPKSKDCGAHQWHTAGSGVEACYHCKATRGTPQTAKLTKLAVSAPNSLLVITGAGKHAPPIPDGVSTVLASDDTILVMTQYSDLEPTDVSVAIEPGPIWPSPDLHAAFDGVIVTASGTVELGNVHLASYGVFDVRSASVHVRIAIDREIEPRRIEIAFDPTAPHDIPEG
ncbi:MAG TPA: hypothetical protein VE011_07010 [Candidatus Dormibacteraeota bacterium]|nr:hypothetical protein [Candidatus Dormibacteraeota bacterium]